MRVAICTMGIVGGYGGTNGVGNQIHPRLSYESLKRKILDVNPDIEFDIFIHTWSHEQEELLKEIYNPTVILAEPQDNFEGRLSGFGRNSDHLSSQKKEDMEDYRFRNFSNWNSKYKTLKLKHEYEVEHSFKYDWVFQTRLDIWHSTPIIFNRFNSSKLYIYNWSQPLGLGHETKEKPDGEEVHLRDRKSVDVTYFSNSTMMDGFLINYPNIKKYSNEPASGIKDWQPVEGHALSYYYTMDFAKDNIIHIGHEFDDWALIRRIPEYNGRRCSDTIVSDYFECVEELKSR
jgi:hypothetical protein